MFTNNPNSWTAPSWHPDFGDAQSEVDRLRTLALALQARNGDIETTLQNPEPGYIYLRVTKGTSLLAQAYWRERECDYAVFVFTSHGEVEAYPKTEADAAAFIISRLAGCT